MIWASARPHIIFLAVLAVLAGAIWWGLGWKYENTIANKDGIIAKRDSQISLLAAQRDDYRDKLNGASPDEAKQRVGTLEKRITELQQQLAIASSAKNSENESSLKNRIRKLFDTIDPQINRSIDQQAASRLVTRMQPTDIINLKKLLDEASAPVSIVVIGPPIIDSTINDGTLGPGSSLHEQEQVALNISPAMRN